MTEGEIYFSAIKEGREGYFVEYRPPSSSSPIALLYITYLVKNVAVESIARNMEKEARHWLERFPIPVMVTSFDEVDQLIDVSGARCESHLISFHRSGTNIPEFHWRILPNEEIPQDNLSTERLLRTYVDVPRKISSELHADSITRRKRLRIGWYVVFVWAGVLPATMLVLEFFSPTWIAALVLLYGLYKAVVQALKILGKWKPSAAERKKADEELRMRHHHYHCELNPEGFARLKAENFNKEILEENRRQAEALGLKIDRRSHGT